MSFKPLNDDQEELLKDLYYGGSMFGRDKLYWSFTNKYPNEKVSRRAVADFLSHQQIQQLYQKPVMSRGVVKPMVSKAPGYIQLDCLNFQSSAFNGYDTCVNATDVFTRYYWCYPCKGQTGKNVVKALDHFMANGMKVSYISSDNGSEFINDDVNRWKEEHSIAWKYAKPGTPWSSGNIESKGGVFKRSLFMMMKTRHTNNWVDLVPLIVKALNSTMTYATGKTPESLQFSDEFHGEAAARNVASANRRYKQKANGSGADLEDGDYVRLRLEYDSANIKKASKEGYWRSEVYEIVDVIRNRKWANLTSSYRIKNKDTGEVMKGTYARGMLLKIPKEFKSIPEPVVNPPAVNADDEDAEQEWEVETILDKRKGRGRTVFYKVKWTGWKKPTWEKSTNLKNAKDLINEYNKTHK